MKKQCIVLIALSFILNACSNEPEENPTVNDSLLSFQHVEANLLEASNETKKNTLKQESSENEELQKMIESFKKLNNVPDITQEDLSEQQYDWSEASSKKYGTPISWVYTPGSRRESGRWIHPDLLKQEQINAEALICGKTGGTYLKSCNELEQTNRCEYIAKSTCECPEGTLWKKDEGCLASDQLGEFDMITQQEFERGYYYGSKKQGTPSSWTSEDGLWHSPFYTP